MTPRLLERLIPPALLVTAGGMAAVLALVYLRLDFVTVLGLLVAVPVSLLTWWYWLRRDER